MRHSSLLRYARQLRILFCLEHVLPLPLQQGELELSIYAAIRAVAAERMRTISSCFLAWLRTTLHALPVDIDYCVKTTSRSLSTVFLGVSKHLHI